MIYIHQAVCISAQASFPDYALDEPVPSVKNKLLVREPAYPDIPAGALRRMGKAVRIGVGAGMAALRDTTPDGIIIGTGNGGIEDSIKFLDQIIEYNEGLLTPGNFVQSTANAIGSQISLIKKNRKYSCTHVHRGLSFEYALLDAMLHSEENPDHQYLVGAVDEISLPNYNIDLLAGWYPAMPFSTVDLFAGKKSFTVAGEGAMMMLVNQYPSGALAGLVSLKTMHSESPESVASAVQKFLETHANEPIDLLLSGEDGDVRHQSFPDAVEKALPGVPVARYKQYSGEYQTAAAFGSWFATQIIFRQSVPMAAMKSASPPAAIRNILFYNQFRGRQHAFYLLRSV